MSLAHNITNDERVSQLIRKLRQKRPLRIMEAHSGLSGLIVEDMRIETASQGGQVLEFDGLWESSLTDSASKGYPDIEVVGLDSRLDTINQILEVTTKPMIVDGDTGGDASQFEYMVKRLGRAGVSMVIIEDKVFPKRNSLEAGTNQILEDPHVFAEKIKRGQKVKLYKDFLIVARLESLIAGMGLADALERAKIYLEAGASGIMIHSKNEKPDEIVEFAKNFYEFPRELIEGKVLICVPTTYNTITDTELSAAGFHIIIHANHLLRASYKAMENVCEKVLLHDRSFEADSDCATVKQIFKKVGFLDIKEKDKEAADILKSKVKVIIPAAGANELAKELQTPISLLNIKGKTILQRQVETLARCGLDNIVVIKGYEEDKFTLENIAYYSNKNYENTHILDSIFTAEKELNSPFIYLNSDILFNGNIINSLLALGDKEKGDIILVVDNSYTHHRHNIDKQLDLVRTNKSSKEEPMRVVVDALDEEIQYIGKKINTEVAQYEFIGIVYFSKRGADILRKVYHSIKENKGSFQESSSVEQASFTDIIQEVVDRGYPVKVMKTYKGWMEIHNQKDIETTEQFLS